MSMILANFISLHIIRRKGEVNMSQDLITQIKIKLVEKKKNQAWLAKQLNISTAYMSDIMNGRRSPEGQIEKIKAALDIENEVGV